MSEPFLIAHVVNAISLESARVEFEIALERDGEWFTNSGQRVWPIQTALLKVEIPSIPDGWIEYLHAEAAKLAPTTPSRPSFLTTLLAKPKAGPPINRRGF